jgi:hypothetical protein
MIGLDLVEHRVRRLRITAAEAVAEEAVLSRLTAEVVLSRRAQQFR